MKYLNKVKALYCSQLNYLSIVRIAQMVTLVSNLVTKISRLLIIHWYRSLLKLVLNRKSLNLNPKICSILHLNWQEKRTNAPLHSLMISKKISQAHQTKSPFVLQPTSTQTESWCRLERCLRRQISSITTSVLSPKAWSNLYFLKIKKDKGEKTTVLSKSVKKVSSVLFSSRNSFKVAKSPHYYMKESQAKLKTMTQIMVVLTVRCIRARICHLRGRKV